MAYNKPKQTKVFFPLACGFWRCAKFNENKIKCCLLELLGLESPSVTSGGLLCSLTWPNNSFRCAWTMRIFTGALCVYVTYVLCAYSVSKQLCTLLFSLILRYFMTQQGTSSTPLIHSSPWLGWLSQCAAQLMPPNKFRALFQVPRLRPFSRGETIYQSRRCLWQPWIRSSSKGRVNKQVCVCVDVLSSIRGLASQKYNTSSSIKLNILMN